MMITMMDYTTAKAATDRKLAQGIADARKGIDFGYTALALLGVVFVAYALVRMMGVI